MWLARNRVALGGNLQRHDDLHLGPDMTAVVKQALE